ncbi:MAG: hypothetical protein R3E79_46450 [Caldilineaceae bacterium]
MFDQKFSRRRFLIGSSAVATGALLAARRTGRPTGHPTVRRRRTKR